MSPFLKPLQNPDGRFIISSIHIAVWCRPRPNSPPSEKRDMIPIHAHKDHTKGALRWRPSVESLERRLVPGEALFGALLGTSALARARDGLAQASPAHVRPGTWTPEAAASNPVLGVDGVQDSQAIALVSTSSPPTREIPGRQQLETSGTASRAPGPEEAPFSASEPEGGGPSRLPDGGSAGVELQGSSANAAPAGGGAVAAPRTASPGAANQGVGPGQPAGTALPWGYLGAMLQNPPPAGGRLSQPGSVTGAAIATTAAPPRGHGDPPPDSFAFSVSLAPDRSVPQLVGEPITWTATAINGGDTPVYQFSVEPSGGPFQVVRDFSPDNSFVWTPLQEGSFDVRVIAEEDFSATQSVAAVVTDPVLSRVTGTEAVITPTANPLVALYSAPPSSAATMHVNFRPADAPDNAPWMSTDVQPCVPGKSINFLVAGMLPDTTYVMESVADDGEVSPPQFFTTGSLPKGLAFPNFTVLQGPAPGDMTDQNLVLHLSLALGDPTAATVFATDMTGQVNWYYDTRTSGFSIVFGTSLEPGGRMLLLLSNGNALTTTTLREIDLAGNTLGETNVDAVNAQLTARGLPTVTGFHHDAVRLPDGKIAVLGQYQKDVDQNGTPLVYDVDMVLVLDQNWQLTWAWDSAAQLDLQRLPTLPDDISGSEVDWTHSNCIAWSPTDGDLLVSLRSQDWVIKIDYAYGTGDGHVVWRLGPDGDFTINSEDPYPWFSHQHDAYYLDDSTLILFDDGNTRCEVAGDCDSRGQVLSLDEQAMTATPVLNAYVGNYSYALGSAQRLADGNYVFTSGFLFNADGSYAGQTIEMLPDGTITYVLQQDQWLYRSFILTDLYGADPTTSPPDSAASPPSGAAAHARSAGVPQGGSSHGGPAPGALVPQIIDQTPSGGTFGAVSTVEVTFNEPVDPTTFTPKQIPEFAGPLGSISVLAVTPVAGSQDTQFDIDFPPQQILGDYAMTIGPDIQDFNGTPMDAPYDAPFTLQGPAVIASTPAVGDDFAGPVNTIQVTFNEPMDPATFTPDKVDYFTGPSGRVQVIDVAPVPGSDDTQFDITFATQGRAGSYTLALGPDILDQFGTPMDQNGDFIPGEFPDDLFTLSFSLQSPRLISQSVNGTLGVYSFRLTFSTAMDPRTFTAAQVSSFTGPDGDIPVVVVPVAGSDFTEFDLTFSPQFHAGDYALVLNPDISDLFGNPLGDGYALNFTLLGPRIASSTPAGSLTAPVNDVRVTLNYPIDATSFTPDQVVQFTGPGGDVPVTGVTAVPGTNQTQFDISFDSQSATGDYQMVFGAGIQDSYGNAVDAGYAAQFTLVAPPSAPGASAGGRGPAPLAPAEARAMIPAQLSPVSDPPVSGSGGNGPVPDDRRAWLAVLDREFVETVKSSALRVWIGATPHDILRPADPRSVDRVLDLEP